MSGATGPVDGKSFQQRALDWLKQPTTLAGLGLILGALVGAWCGLPQGVPEAMGALGLPLLGGDNTTDAIRQRDILAQELAALRAHNAELAATVAAGAVVAGTVVPDGGGQAPGAA